MVLLKATSHYAGWFFFIPNRTYKLIKSVNQTVTGAIILIVS